MEENNLNTTTNTEKEETVKETYTKEEVEALLQRESDRRVTQALKKAEKASEKKIAEAQRLATMSEEDRNKERIKTLEVSLQEKEKALLLRENKIACIAEMEKRNIPTALIDFVVSDDADTMITNLNTFEKALRKMVNDEVEKRIGSTKQKTASETSVDSLTKADFSKLSLTQLNDLLEKNPEIFNNFTK